MFRVFSFEGWRFLMKLSLLLAVVAMATALLQGTVGRADLVNFTVDNTQSFVNVTLAGSGPEFSRTSGTLTLDLGSLDAPFGTGQITTLNLLLNDAMNFGLGGGAVTVSTAADDVEIVLYTPGSAGSFSGDLFDQLGNEVGLTGTANILDPLGLVGGNDTLDLFTLPTSLIDFNSVSVTRSGNQYTLTVDYEIDQVLDLTGGPYPLNLTGTIVATAFAAVPEPSSLLVLAGLAGVAAARRRRR